jgi:uncharacterized membrane protein YeaQ/YmgE (transglycosylase-associated protein family)
MDLTVLAAISSSVGWMGWIIIGAIAGMLAGRVMRGGGFGLLWDIVVGILGAFLGGFLLGLLVTADVGIIWSFVVAFIGACLLLFLLRLGRGKRGAFSR